MMIISVANKQSPTDFFAFLLTTHIIMFDNHLLKLKKNNVSHV